MPGDIQMASSGMDSLGRDQGNHELGTARKMPRKITRASTQRKPRILTRLCFAIMLFVVVAIGNASCSDLQDPSRVDAPAPPSSALQSSAQSRESTNVIRSDTTEIGHFSGSRDFNFTRLYFFVYFVYTLKPIPSAFVLNEASELMHSMTQVSTNISYSKVIGEILLGAFKIDKEYIIGHQDSVINLMQDAKRTLLALPFPVGNDSVLVGDNMQIAVLRTEDNLRDPDITLCSRRDQASPFERIVASNYLSTQSPNDKCYFAMTISNSNLTKLAVLAYPLNWTIRPLPLNENPIHNSRVVDVALTSTKRNLPGNQLLSIFFKPYSSVGHKKGCSYWSKLQDRWTTEGCWVDFEIPNVCHCNLSAHLNEDPTGGQYIVYEYEDVFFNASSYEYLLEHASDMSVDSFFSEASSLMHNISLLTGSKITHVRLPELLLKALRVASQLSDASKTNATMKNIEEFYLNTRNVLKSLTHLPSLEIRNNVLIIFRKIKTIDDSRISFTLQNNFYVKYGNYSRINFQSTIQDAQVTYALSASRSVAEQNKNVIYVLYPMDRFLFQPITNVGHLQVHNFRVIDITLVPRDGVRSDEQQFIDISYKPSVSNTFAKNVQLGCAYWSSHDSVWISEGCVVHVSETPRGCRCNLSAHFDENREGGQYVVYEYSDVILDYKRVDSLEQYIGIEFYQDYQLIEELVTFIHNMTEIGFLSTDSLQYATVIAMRVLSFNQPVLRYAAKFLEPMLTDLHYMVYSWGSDDSAHYSNLFGTYFHGVITSPFAVSLEANDVLSNEVVRTKSSLLHQIVYFVTRLGLPLSNIGVQVTPEKTTYFKTPESHVLSGESQLSYYFTVDPSDKVRFTVVMYPNSKSYLPLYGSLPAIFSCHVLDVTLISEDNAEDSSLQSPSPASSRKFTLVYDSGEPRSSQVRTACATWTRSGWSSETCLSDKSNRHACTCNLTAHALSNGSFLPLLIYDSPVEANFSPKSTLSGLDIVYLVFSTTSLIGLALIGVIAVTFSQWRADVGHKILIHMSLALFLYQSLRIFRETHHVYTAINRDVEGFVAFAAVTHYSRLAHYCWMLTMAWLQLRRLMTMVGAADIPHLLLKVSFVGWGVPLIPLIVLLSWDREEHFARPNLTTHLSLYLVPGGVVTIVNVVILIIILARLFSCFGWGETEDLARHGISGGKLTRRRLATAVLLVFLFGLPTVFEMANDFWGHSLILEVLFKVFDPVRGAVVFVYFILLDRKTYEMWHQKVRSLTSSNATVETNLF